MRLPLIEGKGILLAPVFLVLFVFFVPVSPTIKSIFFGCSVVAILFTPYYSKHLISAYNTIWGRAALLLFAFVLIACIWSPAPESMRLMVVGKYFKLIYLPLFAVCFINPKTRIWCMNSYLAAMLFTCIISTLKSQNLFFPPGDPGEVFYNHIITGFMVALGAYFAGLFAFKYSGRIRMIYVFLVLFTSYQVLFINTGRTGYIVYFVLMVLLFLQKFSLKKAVIGILLFIGVVTLVYNESTIMQGRIYELISDIKSLQHNKENTSLGYRIQFHQYAQSLLMKQPAIGIGTGGFKYSFSLDNPVPSWGNELTDPHGQYWMILAEQGVVGLVCLFLFLGSLFITALKLTETKPILLGMLVSFCIGSVSDTILCYSTAGYLLVVISALCFGELIERKIRESSRDNELSSEIATDSITALHV